MHRQHISRRAFVRWSLGATLAAVSVGAGGAAYAGLVEPRWLAVEQLAVHVPDLPDALVGLAIGHLSDLHCGPYTGPEQVRAAVQAVNSLAPDLVAVTGDYVLGSAGYARACAAELAALRAPFGVFAVAGNHDHWTDIATVRSEMEAAGLAWLSNSAVRLAVRGTYLWLAGLDDATERKDDLDAALAGIPGDEPVLLLVHEPDLADQVARAPRRIVLQLSGHSHGGQVNLPVLGRPVLPWLAQKYPAGLYTVAGSRLQVYTSRGVGVIAPPLRLNCRPEVALLRLQSLV